MNIHEDLSKIGKQLMLSEPFYGVFLSTLNKVVRKDVPTAGVCLQGINYQLAVNEEFWNSLQGDKPKIGLLKHELLHICFNHLLDRDDYPDQELHNVAADIEINQYIAEEYYPSKDLLLPSSYPELNLPLKAGTKVYYGLLKQALESGASPKLQQLMDGLKGEGLHPTWGEFDGLSEADAKLAKSQLEHQIKEILKNQSGDKGRGFIPSELESFIDGILAETEPSYDWRSYFRRFAGTSTRTYTKKTRRKLNKRFQENPALKIKTKKNVLVGIDTSGSVLNEDLARFFAEIHHMYKTGVAITIAEGDADIHNVYEYKGKMPGFVTGRGGTDMNPFIEYFNKHKEFNSLIILTDGYIGSNTVKSFKPTIMVITADGENVDIVKENGWGNTIKMNLAS
jgi:predicted metal-dependent peptidase